MEKFCKILKDLREIKGLTQTQLAQALGYKTNSIIAQWESGKVFPAIENLISIAKYFDVTLGYLVGLEN